MGLDGNEYHLIPIFIYGWILSVAAGCSVILRGDLFCGNSIPVRVINQEKHLSNTAECEVMIVTRLYRSSTNLELKKYKEALSYYDVSSIYLQRTYLFNLLMYSNRQFSA
jgi:hypothetical protein